jgi:hypothetical protein
MKWRLLFLWLGITTAISSISALAQTNLNTIGGFESSLPSYWTIGNQPTNSTLSWATDQFRSMGHSLKIVKTATSDSAAWISENMCDIWSPQHYKDVDMFVGAYVKTSGVNINPATDDAKWYIAYTFYDSAGTLIGETKLPIDQSVATSSGWVADTNDVGATVLPRDSWKTIISFVGGKNATGTVWADDFMLYGRGGAWAGQDWNTAVGVPTGWNYWLPPNGGNDGLLADGFENTVVTNEAAHSGQYSLKFNLPANRTTHDAWVGTRRYLLSAIDTSIKAGDVLRISMWIKASNLVPDSEAKYPGTWAIGVTPIFHTGYLPNDAYDEIGAHDYAFTLPSVTSFNWTQFYVDVTVPSDAGVKAISVRPHVYASFTGTVYYDDITVTKLNVPGLSEIGGFESSLPSYWTIGNQPTNSTLSWATDQFRSMGHSLKIVKTATSDSAAWISENMCDIWSPQHYKDVDMFVGAYVKTSGVNINPATDDAKWYIAYTFYDSAGTLIGETKLPIDQSVATSSGWVADTNDVGATVLPRDSWKTIISFVGGKNATGTVWADDFMLYGRGGAWAGQDWNTAVGVPTGWNYWLPPNGGNDGLLADGFENTVVTNEAAHSGQYSLKFNLPANRTTHDAWVGTRRYLLSNLKAGDSLRVSMWIKASNLVPDSEALYPGTWSVGVTPIFHSGYLSNDAYDEIGAHDYAFTFPNATSFDWTQFYVDIAVPDNPSVKAISVRPHVYASFTGTVYYDDIDVEKISSVTGVKNNGGNAPKEFSLAYNYPNPFNPSTTIGFSIPRDGVVSLTIYNILGQKVRTLFNGFSTAGEHSIVWNARNDEGVAVGSGVYFYRLETAGGMSQVRKMVLLK